MNIKMLFLGLMLHSICHLCAQNTNSTDDDSDEPKGDSTVELMPNPDKLDIYDDSDTAWIEKAVLDVAYYLRAHKFNDFDRRYFNKTPDPKVSNLYSSFPNPPLKYFHWNVFSQCKSHFITCLRYIYETVVDAYLQRSVDTVYVARMNKVPIHSIWIDDIEDKCQDFKELDERELEPFEGALDRFQWRATASYYMCSFTLQKTPQLAHFGEPCDNFANCLQEYEELSNLDIRTNDSIPFQCAMYSFCPDPCCVSSKVIESPSQCEDPKELANPCSQLNNKTCLFNFTLNTSFTSMVYNQWNVTCTCQNTSFEWNSRYGMCVDYNECHHDNSCDPETEVCLNAYGYYHCFCKFGYEWSSRLNKCVTSDLVTRAMQRYQGLDPDLSCAHVSQKFGGAILLVIVHLSLIWLKLNSNAYA